MVRGIQEQHLPGERRLHGAGSILPLPHRHRSLGGKPPVRQHSLDIVIAGYDPTAPVRIFMNGIFVARRRNRG